MLKRIALAVLLLFLIASLGLFFWARSVFTQENVRQQLAAQMAETLGQPVTIGSIGASIYPRVTVDLGDVSIGEPARIRVQALHVGTDFRALLSRRIEHAGMRVDGARIDLPLPPLGSGSRAPAPGTPDAPGTGSPGYVELVSIDEILLRNVDIVSSGHTLRADIDAVPKGEGVTLRRVTVAADGTTIEATGEITNLAGPVGTLALEAGELDFDRLLTFLSEFTAGAGAVSAAGGPDGLPQRQAPVDDPLRQAKLDVTLKADKARSGELVLDTLSGKALVTSDGVVLNPIGFGLFDGRYDGSLALTMKGQAPHFEGKASLENVDMAALVAFAGSPGTISGRLAGRMDVAGSGSDLGAAIKNARGTARVDVANGAIPHLNLVRSVVLATSGRADSAAQAGATNTGGEKFTRLGATLAIGGGEARTDDLMFESPDVELTASGALALNGSAVNLAGLVQLSEALSAQAGRDLVRYTAEGGKVTLPATISGPASQLSVRPDVANAAQRAIRNKATEEINRAIERNLGSIFKRKPK